MKERTKDNVTLSGWCVGCHKTITLSARQILEGERDGAAISDCCFMPIIVEKATISAPKKSKKKRG